MGKFGSPIKPLLFAQGVVGGVTYQPVAPNGTSAAQLQPFNAATAYVAGDSCTLGGLTYVCYAATTGTAPTPNLRNGYWTQLPDAYRGAAPTFAYVAATAYVVGDVITDATGATGYVCIAATTGNAPPNATYWAAFSKQVKTPNWNSVVLHGCRISETGGANPVTIDFYVPAAPTGKQPPAIPSASGVHIGQIKILAGSYYEQNLDHKGVYYENGLYLALSGTGTALGVLYVS